MIKSVKVGKIYTRIYEQDDGQGFYDIVTQYVMITKKIKYLEDKHLMCSLYDIQDHDNTWLEYEDILKEELNEVKNKSRRSRVVQSGV